MRVFLLIALLTLAGCGNPTDDSSLEREAASQKLVPSDPELAELYESSCRSCHTVAATGAPLTGDTQTWAPLKGLGTAVLLGSVVNGFGGMPPMGLCKDCSTEQIEALIQFMATGE